MNLCLGKLILIVLVCPYTVVYAQTKRDAFDAPDQATWHSATKTWFVSNLGGGISLKKDGYGWITRLNASGQIIDSFWVKGLDAPSGSVTTDTKLFVCDRSGVLQIDIPTAKIEQMYQLPGAEFINDIAMAKNGDLYVSDFYGNRIYRLPATNRKAEVFLNIPDSPDGLYVDGNKLIVLTWGKVINKETFETSRKGKILVVDLATKAVDPLLDHIDEVGNLEGITKAGNFYYVTDWMNGRLLRISKESGVEEILTGLKHPTDIDYSNEFNTLAIPEHTGNRVLFLKLNQLK